MTHAQLRRHSAVFRRLVERSKLNLAEACHRFLVVDGNGDRASALGLDEALHHVMFAGIEYRDGTHVRVVVDTDPQGQIGPAGRGRKMKCPDLGFRVVVDEEMNGLDVALRRLRDHRFNANWGNRRVFRSVGRAHIDNCRVLHDPDAGKVVGFEQGVPDFNRRLLRFDRLDAEREDQHH